MRFIRDHAPVNLLFTVDVSSDGLNTYFALISMALLGVGRWGGFSSHKFTPTLWRGWNLPIIGIFSFTRCVVQHLGLSGKSRGIRYVIEGSIYCLFTTFLEEALKITASLFALSVRAGLKVLSGSFWSSCIWLMGIPDPSIVMSLRRYCLFYYLCEGAQKFLEGMIRNCERYLGKSSLWILFSSSCDKAGFEGLSSLISDEIYLIPVFPLIL